jgi:basic membrane lipoprotein Med (substrate-binding protein (PBP1-ABC) superfamily)
MKRIDSLTPGFWTIAFLIILPQLIQANIKVGFIYAGPKNDAGWYSAQDEGRMYLEKNLPGVETMVAENVPETADAERVMERMARAGAKIIFATSYGYFDKAVRVAKRFPDVVFMHSGDGQTATHVGNYFGSTEEPMYLAGIAAAYATKSGKLGYVDAHPIPLQLRGINAFTLGARSVNPKLTVQVIFLNTWKDPTKEAEAANSLIDQGIDVLAQEVDSNLTIAQIAEKRGVSFVGQYYDASKFAPHAWLIGNYYHWGPLMLSIIKEVQSGSWKEKAYLATLASGGLHMTGYGQSIPTEAATKLDEELQDFQTGKRKLWSGPIMRQDGAPVVEAGQVLEPQKVTEMNFLVQGVIGTAGQ